MLYLFLILGSICCALVVLLFFKQKSAYEMRISDWSSDVCSSDLEMPDPDMARRAVEMAIGTIFDVLKDTRMEEFAQQIGRASCRERVCSTCRSRWSPYP